MGTRPKKKCRYCGRGGNDVTNGAHASCLRAFNAVYQRERRRVIGTVRGAGRKRVKGRYVPRDGEVFEARVHGTLHRCSPFVCVKVDGRYVTARDAVSDGGDGYASSVWKFTLADWDFARVNQ